MSERGFLDLIIARLPGLTVRDKVCLCEQFEREDDLVRASQSDVEALLGHGLKYFWKIDTVRVRAEKDAADSCLRGIDWVTWADEDYPPLLRVIYDPPPVLFFRGKLPGPQHKLLGMVGTRKPSRAAELQAQAMARDLGRMGISVVSGLALGIDAICHRGNLDGGAATFAVLGCGLDTVYPSSNRQLARRILDRDGGLISEYPIGTVPYKSNFPARNRIISALSRSVIIMEAPERSGALITADFALEHGRDLWVASVGANVEDNVKESEKSYGFMHDRRGTEKLAADGAEIIFHARNIAEKWQIEIHGEGSDNELFGDMPIPSGATGGRELAASLAKILDVDL